MTKKQLQKLIKEEITKQSREEFTKQSRSKYIKLQDILNENRKQTKKSTNEQKQLNELDMSFWDWVVGGVGIELGRHAFQFAVTLAFVGLSGLAAGTKISVAKVIEKYKQLKRDRQRSKAAKEGQEYIAKTPIVQELIQVIKKLKSKPDLRSKANKILVKNLKSRRLQIGKQIVKDVGLGNLSYEAFEYLKNEIPYLNNLSAHARIMRNRNK